MSTAENPAPAGRSWTRRLLPWAIVGAWVVLLLVAFPLAGKLEGVKTDSLDAHLPANAESTKVVKLEAELPGGEGNEFVVVYEREGGTTQADLAVATRHAAALHEKFGEKDTGREAPKVKPSKDGEALMLSMPVGVAHGEPSDYADELRETISSPPDGLEVTLSGPGGLEADSDAAFENIDANLFMFTAAVVAILLILTYRSPTLWLLPLVAAGAAVLLSQALVYLLADLFDITVSDTNSAIMIILVFGVATDYALLLVARYREELRTHAAPADAMLAALRRSAPAILASSGTVIAGLLCLLVADMNSTSGLGPIGAAGIVSSLVAMLTLLPAMLVLAGRRVLWPRAPRFGDPAPEKATVWTRLGGLISRRPVFVMATSAAVLGALSLGLLGNTTALRQVEQFVNKPESVVGYDKLVEHYPELGGQPLYLIGSETEAEALLDKATATEGIGHAVLNRSGSGYTEINAFSKFPPGTPEEQDTIDRLRDAVRTVDDTALVGGPSAQHLDTLRNTSDDEKRVIPLVLITVMLILGLLLRSITASVVLILTVVLSFAAAYGASVLVYEHLLGFPGLDPSLVMLGFLFLVSLGVDYNIFLMHRAREETAKLGTRAGTLRSLSATGGVITSAGVVLAATFAMLTTLPVVFAVQVGFLVGFGVMLDALLVRTMLTPSCVMVLGRRFWWPDRLSRDETAPAPEEKRELAGSSSRG
ncbi:MMPL family transporter [Streptomyces boncukensis]|uniref:MMPL family transporter n=1 Tax=Streptomyces boncukensis TaxID=2711219 RepID=A0A6G4WX19_9ACTN|nr:MMPL family transporter [Streptomyces boncukensis]NGO69775.1 MMPL family transporter [Streptomyces boncukensis]